MGWDKKGSWVSRMNNQKGRPKTKTNMKYDAMKFRSWVIHAMPNEHNFPMDFFFDFQSTSNFNVVHWISTEWCKQNKIPSHKIWILFEHYENQTKPNQTNETKSSDLCLKMRWKWIWLCHRWDDWWRKTMKRIMHELFIDFLAWVMI